MNHIVDRPELPSPNSTTTAASRSPEELRDMVGQNLPQDRNNFSSSPVTPSVTRPADTASSGTVLTPRQPELVQGDSHHLTPGSTDSKFSPSLVSSAIPQSWTTRGSDPATVIQPQVCRSSWWVKAPMQLIEEM